MRALKTEEEWANTWDWFFMEYNLFVYHHTIVIIWKINLKIPNTHWGYYKVSLIVYENLEEYLIRTSTLESKWNYLLNNTSRESIQIQDEHVVMINMGNIEIALTTIICTMDALKDLIRTTILWDNIINGTVILVSTGSLFVFFTLGNTSAF